MHSALLIWGIYVCSLFEDCAVMFCLIREGEGREEERERERCIRSS
jgi:hypothetical protein